MDGTPCPVARLMGGGSGWTATAQREARRAREAAAGRAAARVARRGGVVVDRHEVAAMAARADKAALTRADLVEVIGAQLPLMADNPGVAAAEGGADGSAGMR